MARVTIALALLTVLLIGGILLQIFLCRRSQKWPGLVLPGICVLFSLVAVLNVAALGGVAETIGTMLLSLVVYNIPTLVLMVIYWICRQKYSRAGELEKMHIADL